MNAICKKEQRRKQRGPTKAAQIKTGVDSGYWKLICESNPSVLVNMYVLSTRKSMHLG